MFCERLVPFENNTEPLVKEGNVNLLLNIFQSVFVNKPLVLVDAFAIVVQVGALDAPWLVKNWPAVPERLFGFNAPLKRIFPVTSNFSVGAALLIPTNPPGVSIVITLTIEPANEFILISNFVILLPPFITKSTKPGTDVP